MLELVIKQRRRDLGGFEVGRVLPYAKRRMVGRFIFFDHMGPVEFQPGIPDNVDVRPHPHIGLATVTYLFEGEIMHRDSVGSEQPIRPGEVNWMTAGRGITHSKRFERARREGGRMDGIQAWGRSHTTCESDVISTDRPAERLVARADVGADNYRVDLKSGIMRWSPTNDGYLAAATPAPHPMSISCLHSVRAWRSCVCTPSASSGTCNASRSISGLL